MICFSCSEILLSRGFVCSLVELGETGANAKRMSSLTGVRLAISSATCKSECSYPLLTHQSVQMSTIVALFDGLTVNNLLIKADASKYGKY